MDAMTARERWQRVERIRQSRRAMLRWRWVVVALGGLLAAALLARGSLVIGGLLVVLVVARVVMLTRMQKLWKERDAAFTRRFGPGSAGGAAGSSAGNAAGNAATGPIDV